MRDIQTKTVSYLNNPFYYLGGITFIFLVFQILSGTFLFMNFVPAIGGAYNTPIPGAYGSLVYITNQLPFGVYLRTFHRYAAMGMLLFAFLHLFRMWSTNKITKPRNLGWVSGLFLVFLVAVIIYTGFLSSYTPQFEAWLMKWADFFEIGRRQYQNLLSLNFGIHLLLPFLILIGLIAHFKRIARPKITPPLSLLLFITGFMFILTALFPIPYLPETPVAFEGTVPTFMQQISVLLIFLGVCVLLALIPLFLKRKQLFAKVDPKRCTGCLYCVDVCPKKAIHSIANGQRVVAFVDETKCQGCGICEGACRSLAIQLYNDPSKSIQEEVRAIWLTKN
ncbi:MAG: 4Fe-4S binding protein [Caldisericia bacterium]|nr:4Fe-4S binding protein [Caldisericia bacterium]MDD4614351.1 4Fe-4S binding protein [Caldisericia bacterium]